MSIQELKLTGWSRRIHSCDEK